MVKVVLRYLVYEKQQNLRIMMKMHGLGDAPYWMISYAYFLTVSSIYMLFFIAVGSIIGTSIYIYITVSSLLGYCFFTLSRFNKSKFVYFFTGLKFFTINDYSIQFVFYFIYLNLQIAVAFLVASMFSNVKACTGWMLFVGIYLQLVRGFCFNFYLIR